jgi:hypothetical protein
MFHTEYLLRGLPGACDCWNSRIADAIGRLPAIIADPEKKVGKKVKYRYTEAAVRWYEHMTSGDFVCWKRSEDWLCHVCGVPSGGEIWLAGGGMRWCLDAKHGWSWPRACLSWLSRDQV